MFKDIKKTNWTSGWEKNFSRK